MSPLHFATSRGHSDIVTTLIEHGAQLDVVNFVSCPNILPVNVKPLMINELLISIKRKKILNYCRVFKLVLLIGITI